MRFNIQETTILLSIIHRIIESLSNDQSTKKEQLLLIKKQLELNEYIKGKLLNVLLNEFSRNTDQTDDSEKLKLSPIIKRIKFKATPR